MSDSTVVRYDGHSGGGHLWLCMQIIAPRKCWRHEGTETLCSDGLGVGKKYILCLLSRKGTFLYLFCGSHFMCAKDICQARQRSRGTSTTTKAMIYCGA